MAQTPKQEKYSLSVTPRTVFGKKLKKLRSTGEIPANIYGTGFKSTAISVPFKMFTQTYKKAKETGIVYLKLDKEELPTLVKHLQRHPVEDTILHIDFRKIDLTQKIETEVPVKVVGESEAVSQKGGVLLTQSDHLLVEALPRDIPQEIEVDISLLKEIGQDIKVSDLTKSGAYTVKDEPEKVVVSVVAHKEESLEPETTAAAPEVITEVKEGEEGAAAAAEGVGAKAEGKDAEPAKEASEAKDTKGKEKSEKPQEKS